MSKKILHNLLGYAAKEGAKKIIIAGSENNFSFNCRFPDETEQSFVLPKKLEKDLTDNLRKLLEIAPGDLAQQKYCKINHKNYNLSFHVSIIPDKHNEKIIINIITQNNRLWRLKQIGLPRTSLKQVQETLKSHSGLVIISSPDAQGKSTTLYSLLQELNKDNLDVYFFEKYPKHDIPGINVLDFNQQNFNKILNNDSNIIAREDIKDKNNLIEIFKVANSGRLVIISMKANNVWEILSIILNLDLPLKLKLDSLKLIINQRIIDLKRSERIKLKNRRQEIGVFESLKINKEIKDFIIKTNETKQKDKFWQNLQAVALQNGFHPLAEDLKRKIKEGLVNKTVL